MFNLVRWYNENRGKFWIVILVVIAVIFFVQVVNNFYKQKPNTEKRSMSSTIKNDINSNISGTLESSTSLVEGTSVSSKDLEKQTSVIDKFIKYCNEGNIENAYNLLTEECKEEVFPSLESFKNKYYNNVFNTYKTYTIQNWSGNTYKLKLTEDALTTGKVSTNSSYLQEYMTVVKKDSEYKLNINNYIGRTKIDKTSTVKGITVNVINKETYMDYSEYTIKIKNTTEDTILLDNGEETDTIYLLDQKDVKQYVNTGEIIYSTLKIMPGDTRNYTFKFSNSYSNTREMRYLVLENVIMNYDEYNETEDKNKYKDFTKITVNV